MLASKGGFLNPDVLYHLWFFLTAGPPVQILVVSSAFAFVFVVIVSCIEFVSGS